jgi:hypothetical protein
VFVPGPVIVHVAFGSHPPLLVVHELSAVHFLPFPELPLLQTQVSVPGPVIVHVAFGSQPPLPVAHAFTAAHTRPDPE